MPSQSFISKLYNLIKSSSILFCVMLFVGGLLDASQKNTHELLIDFNKPLTAQEREALIAAVQSVNQNYPRRRLDILISKPVVAVIKPASNVCPPWPD